MQLRQACHVNNMLSAKTTALNPGLNGAFNSRMSVTPFLANEFTPFSADSKDWNCHNTRETLSSAIINKIKGLKVNVTTEGGDQQHHSYADLWRQCSGRQSKWPPVIQMAPDVSLHCCMDYWSHSANTSRCTFHSSQGKGGSHSSALIRNADSSLS